MKKRIRKSISDGMQLFDPTSYDTFEIADYIEDLQDVDDIENMALSRCRHGTRDDQGCDECVTAGCAGGADCECGNKHSRRRPIEQDSRW